jgi:hypothetical protein
MYIALNNKASKNKVGKISQYIITRHLVEFIVYEFWGRCRNRQ